MVGSVVLGKRDKAQIYISKARLVQFAVPRPLQWDCASHLWLLKLDTNIKWNDMFSAGVAAANTEHCSFRSHLQDYVCRAVSPDNG